MATKQLGNPKCAPGKSTTFEIGGYNYGPGNWYNPFATQLTDEGRSAFTVRFGDNGTRDVIYIGEVGTTWSYPQVYITEVQTGHSGYSSNWGQDWVVDFVTSFTGVEQTRQASLVLTSNNASNYTFPIYASIYYDSDNTNYYGDFASTSRFNRADLNDTRSDIYYDRNNTGYYVNGDGNSNLYTLQAYSYQGNSNVAGTGNASYHPSGIYSTGTNWLYGTMYLNINSINDAADIRLYPLLRPPRL